MLTETATVIDREGDFLWVEAQRQSTCGSCSVNKGCGTGALSKMMGTRMSRMRVLDNGKAAIGDKVTIAIADQTLVKTSLVVYMLPLMLMIAGAMLGESGLIFSSDMLEFGTLLMAMLGFLLGLAAVRGFSRRVARNADYQIVILDS